MKSGACHCQSFVQVSWLASYLSCVQNKARPSSLHISLTTREYLSPVSLIHGTWLLRTWKKENENCQESQNYFPKHFVVGVDILDAVCTRCQTCCWTLEKARNSGCLGNASILKIWGYFSRVLRDSTTRYVSLSVGQSVGRSVGWAVGRLVGWSVPFLLFWHFWAFWAYGSCPDALVTFFSTAPAHPHATRVAMYPALLFMYLIVPTWIWLLLTCLWLG